MGSFSLNLLLGLYLVATGFPDVQPHSWITCTDYIIKNHDVYDASKCRARPRAANSKLSDTFARDRGFDTRPGETNPCQVERDDSQHYDRDNPIAVYYPGQQVVLAHPMKNHGADEACTNKYIPDSGNFIYRGPRNGARDPSLSEFRENLVFNLGVSKFGQENTDSSKYPKPGFQNAPALCDKSKATTDNALGTYSFNVPENLQPGRYSFIWLWAFNGPADLYSTCFEVDIVDSRTERNQKLQEYEFFDLSEPCGGMTSNPAIMGNCNDGGNKPGPTFTTISTSTEKPGQDGGSKAECTCPCCGSLALNANLFLLLVAFLMQKFIEK